MWLCLNQGFLSIVESENDPMILKVRARKRDILEKLFPDQRVIEDSTADYRYRVFVRREKVRECVGRMIMGEQPHPCTIDYTNFKNSVEDSELHALYAKFWSDHYAHQHRQACNQEPVVTRRRLF
jgi:hypothetical protein